MSKIQILILENYLKETGKLEQNLFSMAELEEMAKLCRTDVVEIMYYLRYER